MGRYPSLRSRRRGGRATAAATVTRLVPPYKKKLPPYPIKKHSIPPFPSLTTPSVLVKLNPQTIVKNRETAGQSRV